jgi:hypothetical protein
MIKILLGLSLVVNFILAYFLVIQKPEREIIERKIIETHRSPRTVIDTRKVVQPSVKTNKPSSSSVDEKSDPPDYVPLDSFELQNAGERMQSDKVEFLTHTLGVPEEKLNQHNKLVEDFYSEAATYWENNPMSEQSFESRRKLINLEEDLYKKLERLHGKENWQKFKKFREEYNKKGYKRQTEHNQPFIFMGL